MPFMPLVTTQCHDMVFIVGIFKTPSVLPKIYRSLYNKSATMMFAYLSGKTMLLVSLTGIQQKLQEILNVISLIENACRVNEVFFTYSKGGTYDDIWGN
ncbi:hypothetical protein SDC9_188569 [bioreactor metagenome]|uniref:Uncharacterized protein n=1 Tax=bioreactor metagenome TaxID=1076179 RepID=A0A645HS39_9ZZZZ